jgi:hypothetical protein
MDNCRGHFVAGKHLLNVGWPEELCGWPPDGAGGGDGGQFVSVRSKKVPLAKVQRLGGNGCRGERVGLAEQLLSGLLNRCGSYQWVGGASGDQYRQDSHRSGNERDSSCQ